ncbi:MAG: hypothetical protein B7733_25435 [Myxococcales bacterium FL481]|nr:MAG: hypothetical protein B7733_25435 [Myxococcales bacterium FL481]
MRRATPTTDLACVLRLLAAARRWFPRWQPTVWGPAATVWAGLMLSACAHAPYRDQPPPPGQLLARAQARFSALTVPRATLRPSVTRKLDLMLIAQSPERLRATVQVAGNELVSVALNESGYTLRNLVDQGLAPGFYAGPPSACALEFLIGLSLPPADIVQIILGGAPALPPPSRVVEQRWVRRRSGAELVVVENEAARQKIYFRWIAGNFWVEKIERFRIAAGGSRTEWSVEHEGLHSVPGGILPRRTVFSIPASRSKVSIEYHEQILNPAIDVPAVAAGDSWDDTDNEGWEEVDGTPATITPAATPTSTSPAPATAASAIPPMFVLEGSGLRTGGDVCRQTR